LKRTHREHVAHLPRPDPPHHRQGRGGLVAAQEGVFEHFEDALCLGGEAAIAARRLGPGKGADGIDAPFGIGKKIEMAAIVPRMAGNHFGAGDGELLAVDPAGLEVAEGVFYSMKEAIAERQRAVGRFDTDHPQKSTQTYLIFGVAIDKLTRTCSHVIGVDLSDLGCVDCRA
jgi:hypothetical protein